MLDLDVGENGDCCTECLSYEVDEVCGACTHRLRNWWDVLNLALSGHLSSLAVRIRSAHLLP